MTKYQDKQDVKNERTLAAELNKIYGWNLIIPTSAIKRFDCKDAIDKTAKITVELKCRGIPYGLYESIIIDCQKIRNLDIRGYLSEPYKTYFCVAFRDGIYMAQITRSWFDYPSEIRWRPDRKTDRGTHVYLVPREIFVLVGPVPANIRWSR